MVDANDPVRKALERLGIAADDADLSAEDLADLAALFVAWSEARRELEASAMRSSETVA
jgi:hypothetical protein